MKCVRNKATSYIVMVTDTEAHDLVEWRGTHTYARKSEWKAQEDMAIEADAMLTERAKAGGDHE